MARHPTLFMRIHKTGGEALAKQVLDRLSAEVVCTHQFEWQVRGLGLADITQFSFFQGHISPSSLMEALPDLRVFTMVRSPKERLVSCFFYWKEGSKHARTEFFDTIAGMSLLDFLRSDMPVIRRATWNVQARLLAGGQFGGIDTLRQNVFGPWVSGDDLACEAVRALDRYAFVGVTEDYPISLRLAYALMELGEPPPPERINVTQSRRGSYAELLSDPEIADALASLTQADQVVYEAARRRLHALASGAS
jgi:hypothetical protein